MLVVAGFCTAPSRLAAENETSTGPLAQVRVHVVDAATGEPVAGAHVFREFGGFPAPLYLAGRYGSKSRLRPVEWVQRRHSPAQEADANGSVTLAPDAPGRWLIEAWAEGYAKQLCEVIVGSGPLLADVELRLPRAAAIEGTVADAEGNPLAGALVYASPYYRGPYRYPRGRAAFSDGDGRYRIADVPGDGPLLISASPSQAGFAAKNRRIETPGAENRLDLVVDQRPAGVKVRGLVVDQAGNPVPGARIETDSLGIFEPPAVVTRADGTFVIDDLEGDPPRLVVRAPDFRLKHVRPTSTTDGSFEARVTLLPGHRVAGQVVDERGTPLADVDVAFWDAVPPLFFSRELLRTAVTDAEGRFESDSLPARCHGTFMKRGHATITNQELTLTSSQPLRVVLSRDRVLRGKVIDASTGEPLRSCRVRVQVASASPRDQGESHGFLDRGLIEVGVPVYSRDGTFEISGAPVDLSCQAIVDAAGYVRQFSRPMVATPRGDPPTEIALQPDDPARYVHYRGRLVDEAGAAVSGAELRLIAAVPRPVGDVSGSGGGGRRRGMRFSLPASGFRNYALSSRRVVAGHAAQDEQVICFEKAVSDEEGRFEFAGVPHTPQIVLAWWRPGIAPGWKLDLDNLADEEAGHLVVTVAPPASVTLRVDRGVFPGRLRASVSGRQGTDPDVEAELPKDRDEIEVGDLAEGRYLVTLRAVEERNGREQTVERARTELSLGRGEHQEIELTASHRLDQ
jgi:5-hydroxyisourate hydrolase-like protein (transthyretin family)